MKVIINKLLKISKTLINQPLSFLRFSLSILIGKKLIGNLEFIYNTPNNAAYTLSKTWFTSLLPDSFLSFDLYHYNFLKVIIIISALAAAVGLLGRLNLLVLAFLSYFILGSVEGLGVFDHHLSLPSQVILALALVPGSMKISIDYFILSLKRLKHYKLKPLLSNNFKWGSNLILLLLVLTYFTAGVSKLRYGNGINWLDGNTLGFYLKEKTLAFKKGDKQLIIGDNKIKQENKWKDKFGFKAHAYANYQASKKMNSIANYIASNSCLVILLSIGSVLFELLGFIVFFNSKYRNIYLISAIIFHLSIGALMGISFRQYRLICFCLIDWNYLLGYINTKYKKLGLPRLIAN